MRSWELTRWPRQISFNTLLLYIPLQKKLEWHGFPPVTDSKVYESRTQLMRMANMILNQMYQLVTTAKRSGLAALRQGKWLQGLGALLHPYNFLSLATLLEGRHWVRG